jgi:hypothetical protein
LRYCWACACYFVLRGKYAGYYNSNFQRNFVGLFWPVFAAATDAKRQTLAVIVLEMQKKQLQN